MPTLTPRRLILALGPALAIATAAVAQPAGAPGGPRRDPMAGPRDGPRAEAMRAHHDEMKRQRLEDLRIVLRLRPDQETALAAFAAAHEPPRFEREPPPSAAQTTPQRLEEMARREDAMRTAHQKRREALAKFYAALSPDQQKVFDALQRLGHGPHGGAGRGRMMMMHGGPHGAHGMIRHGGPGPDDD